MAKRKLTLADFTGPNNINTPSPTNTYGIADRDALQAFAWNQDYDVEARRNAIAAAMLAQQVAAPGGATAPGFDQLTAMPNDYRLGGSGDYGMGSGDTPAATGREPGNVTQDKIFEGATPERSFWSGAPPPNSVPPDVPVAPPSAPPDVPVEPDTGRGRVSVTSTPQSIRETDVPPGWGRDEASDKNTPGEGFGGDKGRGAVDAGKGDVVAPGGGTPGAQGFPGGAVGMPSGGTFASAGQGQLGTVAGGGSLAMPGGGAILGTDASKGWGGLMTSPGRAPSSEGEKEADPNAPDPNAPGYTPAFDFANAMASPVGGVPGMSSPGGFVGLPGGVPGGLPGATPSAPGSAVAQGTPGAMSFGGRGGANAALSQTAAAMTSPGLPSPGGFFGPGFSFGASTPAAEMDFGSTPAFDTMGNPTGWGDVSQASVDLGDLGSQGAVDAAGLTDTGIGDTSGATGFGGGGAAGGGAGFGGMDSSGAVGGMSTGGTGETGSVADGSSGGIGGIGGAGMGGGVGSPGTGDFGGATGTSDTSGGGQGDLGSGDGGPGTI